MTPTADLQERFKAGMDRHAGIVHKITNTYCFQKDERVDLAQEILAELWRAFPKYDPQRPFATWMYRIALNVAISHVRRTVRRKHQAVPLDADLHDRAEEPGDGPVTEERIRALHAFIAAQHPLDRALLLLYLEDHSYRDIADILGISETNVGTKIARLKQRIRTAL
jgi:RNA polymerase sigma factor (sigma-70 family)